MKTTILTVLTAMDVYAV
jgi:hypothetical protein